MKRGPKILLALLTMLAASVLLRLAYDQARLPAIQPASGGDFRLHSPAGSYALTDSRGQVVLLYFGYTYCPDICPSSLMTIAQALEGLSQAERAGVRILFVTLDPERDTLERLADYAAFFTPEILPLTGTPEEIAAVARQYGVYYARAADPQAGNSYVIDHSAAIYLIAPDGRLSGSLPHGVEVERLRAAIRHRLIPQPERKTP